MSLSEGHRLKFPFRCRRAAMAARGDGNADGRDSREVECWRYQERWAFLVHIAKIDRDEVQGRPPPGAIDDDYRRRQSGTAVSLAPIWRRQR